MSQDCTGQPSDNIYKESVTERPVAELLEDAHVGGGQCLAVPQMFEAHFPTSADPDLYHNVDYFAWTNGQFPLDNDEV